MTCIISWWFCFSWSCQPMGTLQRHLAYSRKCSLEATTWSCPPSGHDFEETQTGLHLTVQKPSRKFSSLLPRFAFSFFLNYFWRVIIFHIYLSIMWDVGVSMSWYTDGGKRATLVTSSLQCLGPRAWPQTAWQRISLLNHLTNTTLFVF